MSSFPVAPRQALVLVVEDATGEPGIVELLLRRLGYRVESAADSAASLRLLFEKRPELVILGLGAPGHEGWETLERVRSSSSVPVIALGESGTGEPGESDLSVRALRAGADDVLRKPYREDELHARIDAVLRRSTEARRDPLTGLPNRRAFDEHLTGMITRTRRGATGVALVLFDVDNFKQINDLDGHPVGDRVLQDVARTALRQIRLNEELFRVGGDEFAIVLCSGREAARNVAERVRLAVIEQRRSLTRPTVSAGIAVFPSDAADSLELFRKADLALYTAKEAGKNIVAAYGDSAVRVGPKPVIDL